MQEHRRFDAPTITRPGDISTAKYNDRRSPSLMHRCMYSAYIRIPIPSVMK